MLQVEKYEDEDTGESFEMLAEEDGHVIELETVRALMRLRLTDPEGYEALAGMLEVLLARSPLASLEA